MSDILFSVFPNENFVDIGALQSLLDILSISTAGNSVNLHILSDLLPEIIMSFIM